MPRWRSGRRERRRRVLRPLDLQRMHATAVGAHDAETEAFERRGLATLGDAAERLHDEPADGVERIVGELAAEVLVEIVDLGLRLHAPATVALGNDVVLALVEV